MKKVKVWSKEHYKRHKFKIGFFLGCYIMSVIADNVYKACYKGGYLKELWKN